jgi:hypothetical protein
VAHEVPRRKALIMRTGLVLSMDELAEPDIVMARLP